MLPFPKKLFTNKIKSLFFYTCIALHICFYLIAMLFPHCIGLRQHNRFDVESQVTLQVTKPYIYPKNRSIAAIYCVHIVYHICR